MYKYSVMDEKREYRNKFEDYEVTGNNSVEIPMIKIESAAKKYLNILLESDCFGVEDDITVYTGYSGSAYIYFFLGSRINDTYYVKALNIINKVLPKLKRHRTSFLNGDTGPMALGAVLHSKVGEKTESTRLIELIGSIISDALHPKVPDELLYGRAGYLYSLLFLNHHLGPNTIPSSMIKEVIAGMLSSGKELALREKVPAPLMYQWHEKHYMGAAHGLAGILYMFLLARDYMDPSDINKLVRPTIDFLQTFQYTSGNFPSSLETNKDKLVQWCHGAPGMVYLFCTAYQVFKKEEYLKTALQCGESVWQRGILKKGYSLCHGVAGNAYAFLRLYQETHDPKQLHRAYKFAEWCTNYGIYQNHPPDHPWSLFEGIGGVTYFLFDIQQPDKASFPAYSL